MVSCGSENNRDFLEALQVMFISARSRNRLAGKEGDSGGFKDKSRVRIFPPNSDIPNHTQLVPRWNGDRTGLS